VFKKQYDSRDYGQFFGKIWYSIVWVARKNLEIKKTYKSNIKNIKAFKFKISVSVKLLLIKSF
jgi:hypothetical protein